MGVFERKDRTKRRKTRISDILFLPEEVLHLIFKHLKLLDICNLSSTDKQHRKELSRFAFLRIKGTWNALINLSEGSSIKNFSEYVHELRLVDCYSYGEWLIDIFSILRRYFPELKHILINSVNSSSWLKYRMCNYLSHLTLYYEPGHIESILLEPENSKKVKHDGTLKCQKSFSLSHLKNFANLRSLSLHYYCFNLNDDLEAASGFKFCQLSELSLIDCTWEYPYDLSYFNKSNTLKKLYIRYTKDNSFVLLERFTLFLARPMEQHSLSITELSIIFSDFSSPFMKTLSKKQFACLVPPQFPNMRALTLRGWLLYAKDIEYLLEMLQDSKLKLLDIDFSNPSGTSSPSEAVLRKKIQQQCSSLKLKLHDYHKKEAPSLILEDQ